MYRSDPQATDDDDSTHQRKRAKRATCACERCRTKKLRCTGGQPCIACRRAEVECSFGDLEIEAEKQTSAATERLARLESVVSSLASSIDRLADVNRREERAGINSSTHPSSTPGHLSPHSIVASADFAEASQSTSRNRLLEGPTLGLPTASLPRYNISPPRTTGTDLSPKTTRVSVLSPEVSERVDSRWAALQHNAAPFPPLMSHPTAWSEQPASTSPQGRFANQTALGMTQYVATVDIHSEPIAAGILDETIARTLFVLFCQKCHPLFPLLQPHQDLTIFFDQTRSSSPFLFTTTLAIASRYYSSYRDSQPSGTTLPPLTAESFSALADLTYAHLGFVLFRKQHQLEDVQAVLLLAVWILRGKGQSPDQWMVTGLCTRLAYRIGLPNSADHSVILRSMNSISLSTDDVQEMNIILPQWHTWLMLKQYDMSLSLGFGRPYTFPSTNTSWEHYLTIVRKFGSGAQVDLTAATYVASLADLSIIASDLIIGLRVARRPEAYYTSGPQPPISLESHFSSLLTKLNPRLDDWQRRWTWSGSYDTIRLGAYLKMAKIYGEHTRLCLNSLSLSLVTMDQGNGTEQILHTAMLSLARACEATMSLVQYYDDASMMGSVVRYAGEYLILILAQAAIFLVRVLVAPLERPLPIDRMALEYYLKKAIEILEANSISATGVSASLARLCRGLARHAGLTFDTESAVPNEVQKTFDVLDPDISELDWDFDIGVLLGQNVPAGETGVDLGHYFDFNQV